MSGSVSGQSEMKDLAGFRERLSIRTRSAFLVADPERLINYGRFLAASCAFVALYFDPTKPSVHNGEANIILVFYWIFSIFLLKFRIRRKINSGIHVVTHLIDVFILGLLAFYTDELTSPFFSFFPFTLMAMTMRWGLAGAIAGAILLEIVLVVIGIPDLLDGDSELNFLIMGSAYFLVAAIMLGYFGAYRDASVERLVMMANWPTSSRLGDRIALLDAVCGHAYAVLRCDDMFILWREQEGDEAYFVRWCAERNAGSVNEVRACDRISAQFVDCMDAERPRLLTDRDAELLEKLAAGFEQFSLPSDAFGVCAGFSGLRFMGVVCMIRPSCGVDDALMLVDIVAARAGSELERTELMQRQAANLQAAERSKLAQNLHDSVLQDLTAISLKLGSIARLTPEANPGLSDVQALLSEQQHRIREFVEHQWERGNKLISDLHDDLKRHAAILEKKWNVNIPFEWQGEILRSTRVYNDAIALLLSEATANAVRHGRSSTISFSVRNLGQSIEILVQDNGCGMELKKKCNLPKSLKERITLLGGSLSFVDSSLGVCMLIEIPVSEFRN
jgi:signal transduction histidine kinase